MTTLAFQTSESSTYKVRLDWFEASPVRAAKMVRNLALKHGADAESRYFVEEPDFYILRTTDGRIAEVRKNKEIGLPTYRIRATDALAEKKAQKTEPLPREMLDVFPLDGAMVFVDKRASHSLSIGDYAMNARFPVLTDGGRDGLWKAIWHFVSEQQMKFTQLTWITTLCFDIETYTDEGCEFPMPDDLAHARLGVIGLYWRDKNGAEHKLAMIVRPNAEACEHSRIDYCETLEFDSEMAATNAFAEFVRNMAEDEGELLLAGFNSSSSRKPWDKFSQPWKRCDNGYDLPFLVKRMCLANARTQETVYASSAFARSSSKSGAGMYIPAKTNVCSIFGPRVHFIDFYEHFSANESAFLKMHVCEQPERKNLNGLLKAFGLPPKDEVDAGTEAAFELQRTWRDQGALTIGLFVQYCVNDARAVCNLYERINYVNDILGVQKITGCPLSMALHETSGNRVVCAIMASAYKAGIPSMRYFSDTTLREYMLKRAKHICEAAEHLMQEGIDLSSVIPAGTDMHDSTAVTATLKRGLARLSFKGGYNMSHLGELHVSSMLCQFDFASMYPNVIRAFHITPFSYLGFREEKPQADIDAGRVIALQNDASRAMWFDPNSNLAASDSRFPTAGDHALKCGWFCFDAHLSKPAQAYIDLISYWFSVKQDARAKKANATGRERVHLDCIEKGAKQMINSLFGKTGDDRSPLYNRDCAGCVTLGGRIAISHSIETVLARETDGAQTYKLAYSDTDSAAFYDGVTKYEAATFPAFLERMKRETAEINDGLRARILVAIPNAEVGYLDFAFESDKIFTDITYPMKKKAYFGRCVAGENKFKLVQSGCQFSTMLPAVQANTLRLLEKISANYECRETEIREFLLAEREKIRADPAQYSLAIKAGGTIHKSLAARWTEYENAKVLPRVVPVISNEKHKVDANMPLEKLESADIIDVGKIIDTCYGSNLKRMLGEASHIVAEIVGEQHSRIVDGAVVNDDGEIRVRCETPLAGHKDFGTFAVVNLDKLITRLLQGAGGDTSFHELIGETMRLTFDCETEDGSKIDIARFEREVADLLHLTCAPVVLCASNEHKESYHLYYPLMYHTAHLADLARDLKQKFSFIDAGIYHAGHSLRLPLCVKISADGAIDNRMFRGRDITNKAMLSQCFMSNPFDASGSHYIPVIESCYHFEPIIEWHIPCVDRLVGLDVRADIVADIAKRTSLSESIVRSNFAQRFNEVGLQSGFKYRVRGTVCPVCATTHADEFCTLRALDNTLQLFCFGASRKSSKLGHKIESISYPAPDARPELERATEYVTTVVPRLPAENDDEWVKFSGDSDTTVVRASLGSGKTTCLANFLKTFDGRALFVSPRRTFTRAMLATYGAESYEDIRGPIDMASHKRVIVQIDSLPRIKSRGPLDLFVIDEYDSMRKQMNPLQPSNDFNRGNYDAAVTHIFLKTLMRASQLIVMDGFIDRRDLAELRALRRDRAFEFVELVKPAYRDFACDLMRADLCDARHDPISALAALLLSATRPVYIPCASRKVARALSSILECAGKSVLRYDGNDLDTVVAPDGGLQSMAGRKACDFSDINASILAAQPDYLITTTTLTCGVDIMLPDYFGSWFAIYEPYIDPRTFLQMIGRVRHYTEKRGTLVLGRAPSMHARFYTMRSALRMKPLDANIGDQYYAQSLLRQTELFDHAKAYILDNLWANGVRFVKREFVPAEGANPACIKIDGAALITAHITGEQFAAADSVINNERAGKLALDARDSETGKRAIELLGSLTLAHKLAVAARAARIDNTVVSAMNARTLDYLLDKTYRACIFRSIVDEPDSQSKLAAIDADIRAASLYCAQADAEITARVTYEPHKAQSIVATAMMRQHSRFSAAQSQLSNGLVLTNKYDEARFDRLAPLAELLDESLRACMSGAQMTRDCEHSSAQLSDAAFAAAIAPFFDGMVAHAGGIIGIPTALTGKREPSSLIVARRAAQFARAILCAYSHMGVGIGRRDGALLFVMRSWYDSPTPQKSDAVAHSDAPAVVAQIDAHTVTALEARFSGDATLLSDAAARARAMLAEHESSAPLSAPALLAQPSIAGVMRGIDEYVSTLCAVPLIEGVTEARAFAAIDASNAYLQEVAHFSGGLAHMSRTHKYIYSSMNKGSKIYAPVPEAWRKRIFAETRAAASAVSEAAAVAVRATAPLVIAPMFADLSAVTREIEALSKRESASVCANDVALMLFACACRGAELPRIQFREAAPGQWEINGINKGVRAAERETTWRAHPAFMDMRVLCGALAVVQDGIAGWKKLAKRMETWAKKLGIKEPLKYPRKCAGVVIATYIAHAEGRAVCDADIARVVHHAPDDRVDCLNLPYTKRAL